MKKFLRYLIAVSLFAATLSNVAAAQQTFYNKGRVANWSIFKDGDYCWIATRFAPKGRVREMLLMVDSDGEIYLQLTPTAATQASKWDNVSLKAGAGVVSFREDNGWGINPEKDQTASRKVLLSSNRVDFDGILLDSNKRQRVQGHFKTRRGLDAYSKMLQHCTK